MLMSCFWVVRPVKRVKQAKGSKRRVMNNAVEKRKGGANQCHK